MICLTAMWNVNQFSVRLNVQRRCPGNRRFGETHHYDIMFERTNQHQRRGLVVRSEWVACFAAEQALISCGRRVDLDRVVLQHLRVFAQSSAILSPLDPRIRIGWNHKPEQWAKSSVSQKWGKKQRKKRLLVFTLLCTLPENPEYVLVLFLMIQVRKVFI